PLVLPRSSAPSTFFSQRSADPRDLHSFPTRRSSDLTHSYRLLARLAREQGAQASISANDINLLGRKLYAAFQRKAGKVELINPGDRKSTRLNSSHVKISYAVFCLKKKNKHTKHSKNQ